MSAYRLVHRVKVAVAGRPVLYWVAAGALAATAFVLVLRAEAAARHERGQWGDTVAVLVARVDLAPGDPLDATTTAVRLLPAAVVPAGALGAVPSSPALALGAVAAGEIVHPSRVGRPGDSPLTARLPPGQRGVAVPLPEDAPLPLAAGNLVDVVAVADGTGPAAAVAEGATVLHVAERVVVLGVDADRSVDVAAAVATGRAVLVLTG